MQASVSLLPPHAHWPSIQHHRCFHDKGFVRWPPHIRLLNRNISITQPQELEELEQLVRSAACQIAPFEVSLGELGYFEHANSYTLWLDVQSPELMVLQSEIAQVFPGFADEPFVPHLTIARAGSWGELQTIRQAVEASWEPSSFQVSDVAVLTRSRFLQPFNTTSLVPLGQPHRRPGRNTPAPARDTPTRSADATPGLHTGPYVATVGSLQSLPGMAPTSEDAAPAPGNVSRHAHIDLTLEAATTPKGAQEGIWWFAYGPEMCARKLRGRGVHPLRSQPALLPGYALAFNHRGGAVNLVPRDPDDADPCVHGVAHLLTPEDMAKVTLATWEHWPCEAQVVLYDSGSQDVPGDAGAGRVCAVLHVSPPERHILYGLPPSSKYLNQLVASAQEGGVSTAYVHWLSQQTCVDPDNREPLLYMSSPSGELLSAWPRNVRTGSDKVWATIKGGAGKTGARRRAAAGSSQSQAVHEPGAETGGQALGVEEEETEAGAAVESVR